MVAVVVDEFGVLGDDLGHFVSGVHEDIGDVEARDDGQDLAHAVVFFGGQEDFCEFGLQGVFGHLLSEFCELPFFV